MSSIRSMREERAEANRMPVFSLIRAAWRQVACMIRHKPHRIRIVTDEPYRTICWRCGEWLDEDSRRTFRAPAPERRR